MPSVRAKTECTVLIRKLFVCLSLLTGPPWLARRLITDLKYTGVYILKQTVNTERIYTPVSRNALFYTESFNVQHLLNYCLPFWSGMEWIRAL